MNEFSAPETVGGIMGYRPSSRVISGLLFLAALFFLNFTARVIFSPLLPMIEGEFGLGHAAAGSLFLFISGGYFISILSSGFVSSRINHKKTIVLSTIASGIVLISLSLCSTLFSMRIGLFSLGLAAGLYLPSGLASVSRLVKPACLARGMAVHELAPNLGFVAAPLLAEMMLRCCSWQQGLMWLGLFLIGAGLFYEIIGEGCQEYGKSLDIVTSRALLSRPEFWIMVLLFSLAICASLAVYAMLPLFLVSEKGMTPERASRFLAFSRTAALMMPLLAGWFGDKVGNRTIMAYVLMIAGLCTVLLGVVSSLPWLMVLVTLQPMVAVSFFPSGFAVLSGLGTEGEGALVRQTAKLNTSIYLPFVVSLSNHEQKISSAIASIHPSTSSGRTEAVVGKWNVLYLPFALSLSLYSCGLSTWGWSLASLDWDYWGPCFPWRRFYGSRNSHNNWCRSLFLCLF